MYDIPLHCANDFGFLTFWIQRYLDSANSITENEMKFIKSIKKASQFHSKDTVQRTEPKVNKALIKLIFYISQRLQDIRLFPQPSVFFTNG